MVCDWRCRRRRRGAAGAAAAAAATTAAAASTTATTTGQPPRCTRSPCRSNRVQGAGQRPGPSTPKISERSISRNRVRVTAELWPPPLHATACPRPRRRSEHSASSRGPVATRNSRRSHRPKDSACLVGRYTTVIQLRSSALPVLLILVLGNALGRRAHACRHVYHQLLLLILRRRCCRRCRQACPLVPHHRPLGVELLSEAAHDIAAHLEHISHHSSVIIGIL